MKEKKITLDLWHQFTPEELEAKGQELAHANLRYDEVEGLKKAASDSFKEQLEALVSQIWLLSGQVRNRGLNRPVECVAQFHTPAVGRKRIVRLDTGELVREEAMTPSECQENLFSTEPIEETQAAKA